VTDTEMLQQTPPTAETIPTDAQPTQQAAVLTITLEGAAYLTLACLVSLMFLIRLGIVPLTVDEAPRALAAWQALELDAEPTVLADSALLQLAHMLSFTIFGTTEAAARTATALVGVFLVLSPLLFRGLLGPTRTFITVLILVCSPVVLAASRLDSPVVWQMAFAMLSLWAVYRWWLTGTIGYSFAAIGLFTALILLTGPTGHVTAVMLIAALLVADHTYRTNHDGDLPSAVEQVQSWPWLRGIGLAVAIAIAASTSLMLYPAGLNAIGQAISAGLAGWVRPVPQTPLFYGMFASLLYELFIWAFAGIGVLLIFNQDDVPFLDTFLVTWLLAAAAGAIVYQGTLAFHALWLTLPLAGLASQAIYQALQDNQDNFIWYVTNDRSGGSYAMTIPVWTRWAIAGGAALFTALLLMQTTQLALDLLLTNFSLPLRDIMDSMGLSLFFQIFVTLIVVFAIFSVASLYGAAETLKGAGIGVFIVGLVASLGTGWQISVSRADDPTELWHSRAHGEEVFVLREQLLEIAERRSEGFPAMAVTVVTDDQHIHENGIIAWAIRDFRNATFVSDPAQARTQEVIIAPMTPEVPNLGGNYVGQAVVISRDWNLDSLTAQGMLAWWIQRRTRIPAQTSQEVVLWLRQDVYDGTVTDPTQP
jgi:hypothetical protein